MKHYRLKENIKQGIFLIALGCICHKVGADGAAIIMWLLGTIIFLEKKEEEVNDSGADRKLSQS